jgi:hypothetical protein
MYFSRLLTLPLMLSVCVAASTTPGPSHREANVSQRAANETRALFLIEQKGKYLGSH